MPSHRFANHPANRAVDQLTAALLTFRELRFVFLPLAVDLRADKQLEQVVGVATAAAAPFATDFAHNELINLVTTGNTHSLTHSTALGYSLCSMAEWLVESHYNQLYYCCCCCWACIPSL